MVMTGLDQTGPKGPGPRARAPGPSRPLLLAGVLLGLAFLPSCALVGGPGRGAAREHELKVRASAFNSLSGQTDHSPTVTAFGTHLAPGMRIVAVSSDLYDMGLKEGTRLRIEGLAGEWRVGDRMNSRWRRKIDVYMGTDVRAAREWGVRTVVIRWWGP